jgi:hypothetical protein
MCNLPLETIVHVLNTPDPLVSKLKLLGDLSPLVDEAPEPDRGRVAIGLLEIVADYTQQLETVLATFTNRLPRPCGEREMP